MGELISLATFNADKRRHEYLECIVELFKSLIGVMQLYPNRHFLDLDTFNDIVGKLADRDQQRAVVYYDCFDVMHVEFPEIEIGITHKFQIKDTTTADTDNHIIVAWRASNTNGETAVTYFELKSHVRDSVQFIETSVTKKKYAIVYPNE